MIAFTSVKNNHGMQVTFCNLGARITNITLSKDGVSQPMLCGYRDESLYEQDLYYMGAVCGPVCNRISHAQFTLNGTRYPLEKNENNNTLHSGKKAISNQYWTLSFADNHCVVFSLTVAHLEDDFPGNRVFQATYTLGEDNTLNLELSVSTDQDTPLNLTNHAYFNLGEENVRDLEFTLQTSTFLEKDEDALPTGRIISTKETKQDTKQWQSIKNYIGSNAYGQILKEQGVDHCFIIENDSSTDLKQVAQLRSRKNAIQLDIYTNQNTIQFYTGHWLGDPFVPYGGVCFECQDYVDAVNQTNFPSIIVKKDTKYINRTVLKFVRL